MILLQVFSHCAFMLSLPGFVYVFFLFLIYCSTQENQGYFHYHTTIQPTYPLSPSLPSFSLSYSICLPHQLYPTNTAIFTPNTYTLHLTQHTIFHLTSPSRVIHHRHTLPSHLPLCYTMHTHTTISQCLLLHLFLCFTNYAPTLLLLMAHTLVTPPFSFSFPLENLFSCDSYCQ